MSKPVNLGTYEYIHVKDKNKNVTRVEEGPQTFIPLEHEFVIHTSPKTMENLSRREYCIVKNPVLRENNGDLMYDKYGQVKNQHGEFEYRFYNLYSEPWPLYPGEIMGKNNTTLTIVQEGTGLKIRAIRDFKLKDGEQKYAGDEWLFQGLATYYPRVEEDVLETIYGNMIKKGQALRVRANQELKDKNGIVRKAGEEWLVRDAGKYLPKAHESVISQQDPILITEDKALILRASQNFLDFYNVERKAGEEWLLTIEDSSTHIIDIFEEELERPSLTVLKENNYCTILDPWNKEKKHNLKGTKLIKKGKASFFLYPGESLEGGIKPVYVLNEKEAVLVKATEKYVQRKIIEPERYEKIIKIFNSGAIDQLSFARNKKNHNMRAIMKEEISLLRDFEENWTDYTPEELKKYVVDEERAPGDKWMCYGPLNYIPPVQIEVLETLKEIPLDRNEGVYVRDTKSG